MSTSRSTKQPSTARRKTKSLADDELMAKVLDLFPDLKNFDVETGERAIFEGCWEALQRQLPEKLRSEPLVLGTLLLKMKANPEWAGGILMEVYQLNG